MYICSGYKSLLKVTFTFSNFFFLHFDPWAFSMKLYFGKKIHKESFIFLLKLPATASSWQVASWIFQFKCIIICILLENINAAEKTKEINEKREEKMFIAYHTWKWRYSNLCTSFEMHRPAAAAVCAFPL